MNTTLTTRLARGITLALAMTLLHCDGTVENTQGSNTSESDIQDTTAVFFSTDYMSPGVLSYVKADLSETALSTADNSALGSSATLSSDDAGLLYVLHDGYSAYSLNNLTIFNPSNSFSLDGAGFSTGDATNPVYTFVKDGQAYISLLDGANDPSNIDSDGHAGDVIVMNTSDGSILDRISLNSFLDQDGDVKAYPGSIIEVDGLLYVLLQDLQSDYSINTVGKLVSIDPDNGNATALVATLSGHNPQDIAYSSSQECFLVSNYDYDQYYSANLSSEFGGLEWICDGSTTLMVDDQYLGGYPEKVIISDTLGKIFVVVSSLTADYQYVGKIVGFDLAELAAGNATPELTSIYDQSTDIRDMALDSDNKLWIATRTISTQDDQSSNPLIAVVDAETGDSLTEYDTGLLDTFSTTSIVLVTPQE